jgi:hypothetical protein
MERLTEYKLSDVSARWAVDIQFLDMVCERMKGSGEGELYFRRLRDELSELKRQVDEGIDEFDPHILIEPDIELERILRTPRPELIRAPRAGVEMDVPALTASRIRDFGVF